MRFSGDAIWLQKKDWRAFCEYEKQLNESIADQPMIAFCTYPLSASGAADLLDVARNHQFALARRGGGWEVIETPELMQAREEIKRLNKDLEQRVTDRTKQLSAVNEELRKEVIERERAEGLLQEANARAETILDSITDRFFAFDKQCRFTYFNRHANDLLKSIGKDPASLIGKVYWDEFPVHYAEEAVRRAMTDRVVVVHEFYFPPLKQWIEGRIYPSPDGGFAVYQRDITERKRAEEGLRRSEAYLAEGQRISHTGSWAVTISSGDVYWSQEMFRIYGLDPATTKLSQEMAFQLIHPEDRAFVQEAFDWAVREKSDYAIEHRAIVPDGTIKYLHALGHPVLGDSDDLIEYVGTVVDITERKQAEEALRKAHERTQMLLDTIADNFFGLSKDWRFTYFNKHAAEQMKLLGKDPERLIGKVLWDEFPEVVGIEMQRAQP
jgi:PAS domain S-box-containing protein